MLNKDKILQILRKNFISDKFSNTKLFTIWGCEICPISNRNTNYIWGDITCKYRIRELTGKSNGAGSTTSSCNDRIEFFKNLCKCKTTLMETE